MLRLLLGAAAGILAYRTYKRTRPSTPRHVRDAGPGQMRNPPRRWDIVDETADESFPASDPPGTY
ncbi:hypothetical protein OB2597_01592 [Pseudooceanicola batsensis HTCC2597]|uniref:Uncharacterized protein n=1 Tax=Pseudooceanicola batsensis (strain ATCC BAA-863 / DSM 15984 / KCTC 12145 / HTCC2597) TaxID=252305 RepID=A3U311_PSEBH|nr:hypothetical protein [Pseudooceanicola batsensis]EAQ01541.1 hypothetical protein OB2597_01592 [Pseudooceanicola batsensis HTCC2597]